MIWIVVAQIAIKVGWITPVLGRAGLSGLRIAVRPRRGAKTILVSFYLNGLAAGIKGAVYTPAGVAFLIAAC